MGWKILERLTRRATKPKAVGPQRLYLARVDGLMMGRRVEFGITNRCATCKGTGRRYGKKGAPPCMRCGGKGYIYTDDDCMHECGCTNKANPSLVFICNSCLNGECEYSPSAFDVS
jgi:RecJ-like exonuclease